MNMTLDEYLKAVHELKGIKLKMTNPVVRASYEWKSLKAGRWLTLEEFEESI